MGETPVFKWPWPEKGTVADGPKAVGDLANAIETTFRDPAMIDFLPRWHSVGALQPANPLRLDAKHRVLNGWMEFYIHMEFGPATKGGNQRLQFDMPIAAAADGPGETWVMCKLYVPGYYQFNGMAYINAGSPTLLPQFPAGPGSFLHDFWRSADASDNPGTGIPQIPGIYPISTNGNFWCEGRYRV